MRGGRPPKTGKRIGGRAHTGSIYSGSEAEKLRSLNYKLKKIRFTP